ncbi:hypothetical protein [Algoriphagus machipongonensis]|nr:hypothetical protein [Algoriphagus machipongonensis]
MKNYFQSSLCGLAMVLTLTVLVSSCISDESSMDQPLDPTTNVEKTEVYPEVFSLENLRMDPETLKMLANLRAATAKYHDIEVAMEDGYAQGSECVSSPAGGMGYHYVNFAAMDGEYDPTMPEALLYEMSKNGQMKLVGVEFVIVKEAWDAGNEMVPYFGMQEFDTAFDPEPLPFDNYQLHIWIWKNNPSGIFTMFNPNVSCE